MAGRVPLFPPILLKDQQNAIRAAAVIRGPGQWQDMALANNWLLGKNSSLIVAGPCHSTSMGAGDSILFRYYIWPHEQCTNRLWSVQLYSSGTTPTATGTFKVNGTTVATWKVEATMEQYQPACFVFNEPVASPSSTPGELQFTVTNDATSGDYAIYVGGITCYELPRTKLEGGFTHFIAPDERSLGVNQPIYEDVTTALSLNGVIRGAEYATGEARRGCLMSWFDPVGVTSTATSFTGTSNIFATPIPVLGRLLYSGDTQRGIAWAFYAKVTGGGAAGQVRVTESTGGGVTTVSVSSTSGAWVSSTMNVDAEDVQQLHSHAGIRNSGTRCFLTFEERKTAGTSITIYGICLGEPPP